MPLKHRCEPWTRVGRSAGLLGGAEGTRSDRDRGRAPLGVVSQLTVFRRHELDVEIRWRVGFTHRHFEVAHHTKRHAAASSSSHHRNGSGRDFGGGAGEACDSPHSLALKLLPMLLHSTHAPRECVRCAVSDSFMTSMSRRLLGLLIGPEERERRRERRTCASWNRQREEWREGGRGGRRGGGRRGERGRQRKTILATLSTLQEQQNRREGDA